MRKVTKRWTQKDGTKIRICDMADSHLKNTIRMIERIAKARERKYILTGYQALGCVRGEMAEFSIECELRKLEEHGLDPAEVTPLYEDLSHELIKRGLTMEDPT